MAADRDLLFGMLALQNSLIDSAGLAAAFKASARDRTRSLPEHLTALGDLDAEDRLAVETLVERHLKRHGGDAERSLASISAGSSIRDMLEALNEPNLTATIAHLGRDSTEPDSNTDRTSTYGLGTSSADGQRFRVIRPHARGGLGAVFVAIDGELNREVALKQILDGHADDPRSRQRFLLEAEITGGLEHPGIVPVYGLGAYGDGRPFYAMRFIRGDSLKVAIGRFHKSAAMKADPGLRSMELRKLLRRFLDVCNAIEYAHGRGVLHRDIKPGNVIVGRHGETLVVDWGLAKATGKSDPAAEELALTPNSGSGSSETQPGSALGTPAYMSPEQARGDHDRLGPASDVYSLGAMLYTLLTARPPFLGQDAAQILRDVKRGEFPRPREVDLSIDPALEAVCLKAMANDPANRYDSARAVAEEVERWMADEPVTAWSEPLSRRARRWVRRNRTVVTGAAVAFLAGVVGLAAVAVVQASANKGLIRANTATSAALVETARARDLTEAALARSEVLLRDAEESRKQAEAISKFLTGAFRSADPSVESREVKVVDVLDRATKELEAEFKGSEATRGSLLHALGETYLGLGIDAKAVSLHAKALRIREAALGPNHPDTLSSRNDLGWSTHVAGRSAEAIPILEAATKGREAALGLEHPDTLSSRNDLGCVYRSVGRTAEAVTMHEKTLKLRERILGPDDPETLNTRGNLAVAYRNVGRLDEAVAIHERTVVLMTRRLSADHPMTLLGSNNLAMAYAYARRWPEALALHEKTYRRREAVLGVDHTETFISRNNLATTYERTSQFAKALAMHEGTLRLSTAKYGPDHAQTISAQDNLARLHEALGQWADAEPYRRLVLTQVRKGQAQGGTALTDQLNGLGNNLLRQQKWPEAEALVRESGQILNRTSPDSWPRFHAMSLLGEALMGQSRFADAEPPVLSGYEGMKAREAKIPAAARTNVGDAAKRVVRLYEAWDKPDQARIWAAKLGLGDLPNDVFARP